MIRSTRLAIALILAALTVLLAPMAANAATQSWTATRTCSNGISVQGHYEYYYSNGVRYTRANGYAFYANANGGYLRSIVVAELRNGQAWGIRTLNFTGTAKQSSIIGGANFSTGYLPFMVSGSSSVTTMTVDAGTTTGNCYVEKSI